MEEIKKFQAHLRKNKIDYAIISNRYSKNKNIIYFLGENLTNSFLLIPKKGNSKLIVSVMEKEYALKKFPKLNILQYEKSLSKQLSKILAKHLVIGIDKMNTSMYEMELIKTCVKKKKFTNISDSIGVLRKIKLKNEIKKISKACKISDSILKKCFENFSNFKKESDIQNFLQIEIFKNNCKSAFDILVASGKNAANPHYPGGNVKLKKGFGFIDFGVEFESYKSDTTRCFFIGSPKKSELKFYNLLLDIQKQAIEMIKPGVTCSEIDLFVRNVMGKYEKNYIHSLGHGVGLDIHEAPGVHVDSKEILREGMIITIEPGIYLKNKYGIRIEDTVLVTKNGHKILTKVSKELVVINNK